MKISEQAKQHIMLAETDKAILLLIQTLKNKQPDLYNECLLYSARYKKLMQEQRMGLLEAAQFKLQLNQINYAVINIIDLIEEENNTPPTTSSQEKQEIKSESSFRIFISYAHEDTHHLDRLNVHVEPLRTCHNVSSWDDNKILPGDNWDNKIKAAFEQANLVIILVSADYLSSTYCKLEMEWAFKSNKTMIPILVEPCMWQETDLKNIQMLPKGAEPISTWKNKEEAYSLVAAGIRAVITTG